MKIEALIEELRAIQSYAPGVEVKGEYTSAYDGSGGPAPVTSAEWVKGDDPAGDYVFLEVTPED